MRRHLRSLGFPVRPTRPDGLTSPSGALSTKLGTFDLLSELIAISEEPGREAR